MKLHPNIDLTYCLNVHPGESWQENFQAIKTEACRVRDQVCPQDPFGLGLRLGKQAVDELKQPGKVAEFKAFLEKENLYVFTINAFPYGNFHSSPVKEDVYRPDWTDDSRVEYTLDVARILAALLPEGDYGSISTVPVSYKGFNLTDAEIALTARNLIRVARELDALAQQTGRIITLALEPEPDCLIENTNEFLDYYQNQLLVEARSMGVSEALVRLHVGICFDTAHAAVEFEDPVAALNLLDTAGITIAKIQLSAALVAYDSGPSLKALRAFCEPVYLHQTKVRRNDGTLAHFADLADALQGGEDGKVAGRKQCWEEDGKVAGRKQCWEEGGKVAGRKQCWEEGGKAAGRKQCWEEGGKAAGKVNAGSKDKEKSLEQGGQAAVNAGAGSNSEEQRTNIKETNNEWRVHYHVPLFWEGNDTLRSSSDGLPALLAHIRDKGLCRHLEIETYTFTVLPPDLAPASLTDGIVEEFSWVLKEMSGTH